MKKKTEKKARKQPKVDAEFLQSSYLVSLEEQVDYLRAEVAALRDQNRLLLDRLIHMATGAPLVLPASESTPERQLTPEQKEAVRASVDKMSADKPFGGYPTMHQLFSAIEATTFQQAADAQGVREEIEPGSEVKVAAEQDTEEQRAARLSMRKQSMLAAAKATQEYLENTAPVLR